jgi:hypothetical protein
MYKYLAPISRDDQLCRTQFYSCGGELQSQFLFLELSMNKSKKFLCKEDVTKPSITALNMLLYHNDQVDFHLFFFQLTLHLLQHISQLNLISHRDLDQTSQIILFSSSSCYAAVPLGIRQPAWGQGSGQTRVPAAK